MGSEECAMTPMIGKFYYSKNNLLNRPVFGKLKKGEKWDYDLVTSSGQLIDSYAEEFFTNKRNTSYFYEASTLETVLYA